MTPMFKLEVAQVDTELTSFIDLLLAEGAHSYLEIGSQFGGSLWRVASKLPKGSLIVSVDYPTANKRGSTQDSLQGCINYLKGEGYNAHVFFGDSTRWDIVSAVSTMAPFDACLIDANHTLDYVTCDWKNYGQMCRLVGFHDIKWDEPVEPGRLPIEVSQLWNRIKVKYSHEEFVAEGSQTGIGVLWNE